MQKTATMKNFIFQTVPVLHFGEGCLAELPGQIAALRASTPMIVTDRGIVDAGLIAPVEQTLRAAGLDVAIFDAVVADPPEKIVLQAIEAAKSSGVDIVIGLGGGSSLDTAKVVAALAVDGAQPLSEIYGVGALQRKGLPTILIPTTSGTGSEVTAISILTTGETTKAGIVSPYLFADVALLDPALTLGLPAAVTAATGMDALTHGIESFINTAYNPIAKALALESIRVIGGALGTAYDTGGDLEARTAMLLGSTMAAMAFTRTRLGNVHAMSHPLGAHFDVPHGVANAILLPYVMAWNLRACTMTYPQVAAAMGERTGDAPEDGAAQAAVDAVARLSTHVGIPARLREVGVTRDAIPAMAADAMKSGNVLVNPRATAYEDIVRLFETAF